MTASPPKHPKKSEMQVPSKASRLDVALVLAILLTSVTGGTVFWNAFRANGYHPSFYQEYFEPAVMIACGKGFVVSTTQPALLVEFLKTRRDSFNCADIPRETVLGRDGLYQGTWRYLLSTVGWFWRLRGVTWSGLGPLIGLFFALTIAFIYAICRIGMGPPMALFAAFSLATSPVHLMNLPHLRDYSKAPFTLALIFILGLLVVQPVRRRTVFVLASAYGAVLGMGYGFRTDFLANLPVFPLVLFVFLAGGFTRNLALKSIATVIFFATFFIVSWPITSTVYAQGGCQWHVALLGLQSPFDSALHIAPASYNFGYAYRDEYIQRSIAAFASRSPDAPESIVYCSHEYDVQSWKLLKTFIVLFPADFVARALAAMSQIIELPFEQNNIRVPQWADWLYRLRVRVPTYMRGSGKYWGGSALLILSATSLRLAFFLLFFILYFGGYPAIQFDPRHYFHLELITWWSFGFVVDHVLRLLRHRENPRLEDIRAALRPWPIALFIVAAFAIIVLPLIGLRLYQRREAKSLLSSYIDSPKQPILSTAVTGDGPYVGPFPIVERPTEFLTQFVEIDLNLRLCQRLAAVTFRYDAKIPSEDFTHTVTVGPASATTGMTRIFMVLYESFKQLEFAGVQPGCIVGAYRLTNWRSFPVLLDATLPPEWERQPLHQRLIDWEGN